jgi:hypothetical protein
LSNSSEGIWTVVSVTYSSVIQQRRTYLRG